MNYSESMKSLSNIFSGKGGTVKFFASCLTLLGVIATIVDYNYELKTTTFSGTQLSFKSSTVTDPAFQSSPDKIL